MNKKFLACALACVCLGAVNANAQRLVKETYFGEKARDSAKNPCKGTCLKVCGERTYELISNIGPNDDTITPFSLGGETTKEITTLKVAEGNVIAKDDETYAGDVDTVAKLIMARKAYTSVIE